MSRTVQDEWIKRAKAVLPAGGFGNFDSNVIIREGHGSRVIDENGKEYVDYHIGSGPMMLGHGHPEVLEAIQEQLGRGQTFFANNTAGIELAEAIIEAVACAEKVRYVASGSEADMYALRAARAFTGRTKILKFEGGYHGMSAEAQMSLAPQFFANFPQAVPDSAGIPVSVRDEMLIAPFNDIGSVRAILDEYEGEVAAIIVEPLQRIVPPVPGFLLALREECTRRNIVLVFDEIVTGFRLAYGGAQEVYSVTPDLCTLGKVIGGGFALAAIVGREDIMAHFDKSRVGSDDFIMQLGTLSGAPVACVAGLKTLEILRREGQYEKLHNTGLSLMRIIQDVLDPTGVSYQLVGGPVLFDVVFTSDNVVDYRSWRKGSMSTNRVFNATLREYGVFKSPGKLYSSLAINEEDLSITHYAYQQAAKSIC